jgi:hypothetical protein
VNLNPVDNSDIDEVKVFSTDELVMFSDENITPSLASFSLALRFEFADRVKSKVKFIERNSLNDFSTLERESTETKFTLRSVRVVVRKFTKFDSIFEVHTNELLLEPLVVVGDTKKFKKATKIADT